MTYIKNHIDREHVRFHDNCDECCYKIIAEVFWSSGFEYDWCKLNEDALMHHILMFWCSLLNSHQASEYFSNLWNSCQISYQKQSFMPTVLYPGRLSSVPSGLLLPVSGKSYLYHSVLRLTLRFFWYPEGEYLLRSSASNREQDLKSRQDMPIFNLQWFKLSTLKHNQKLWFSIATHWPMHMHMHTEIYKKLNMMPNIT